MSYSETRKSRKQKIFSRGYRALDEKKTLLAKEKQNMNFKRPPLAVF